MKDVLKNVTVFLAVLLIGIVMFGAGIAIHESIKLARARACFDYKTEEACSYLKGFNESN